MKNRIYTYANLKRIENNSWFSELKDYPQITVSSDLRKGINHGDKGYKHNAFDFRKVLEYIVPNWTTDETKFQETVILAQYIREKIFLVKDQEEKKWLVGYRRNLSSILSAIILLEEAKVVPEDLMPEDKNLELFIELWNYLIERDPEIAEFRSKMKTFDSERNVRILVEALFGSSETKKLVIHGFYYFTPIQWRVLEAFEHQGYELIYIFPFDDRYKVANEIWLDTYSSKRGLIDDSEWTIEKSFEKSVLGALLEGEKSSNEKN